jgi:hypothetical protein
MWRRRLLRGLLLAVSAIPITLAACCLFGSFLRLVRPAPPPTSTRAIMRTPAPLPTFPPLATSTRPADTSTPIPSVTATSSPSAMPIIPTRTATVVRPTSTPAAPIRLATVALTQPAAATSTPVLRAPTAGGYVCAGGQRCIKGNISTKGEKIYHYPGCASYDQTQINEGAGERWFASAAEAEAAGWRRAGNCP